MVGNVSPEVDEELFAFVVCDGGVDPGDIMTHCRNRLTSYKVPREIIVVDRLPKTSTGKVMTRALVDLPPDR